MDNRVSELQYKKIKMWRQNLKKRIPKLKDEEEQQKEKYEAWI
jgi:predicted HTH domain antitoxin